MINTPINSFKVGSKKWKANPVTFSPRTWWRHSKNWVCYWGMLERAFLDSKITSFPTVNCWHSSVMENDLILFWFKVEQFLFSAVRPPPIITKFSPKDLINPDEVKFNKPKAFSLPCQATGLNLTWTWKHNGTKIPNNFRYKLSEDGTLTGSYLNAEHSGTYQCFVKDEETGVEVFSRKLQVAVTGRYLFN